MPNSPYEPAVVPRRGRRAWRATGPQASLWWWRKSSASDIQRAHRVAIASRLARSPSPTRDCVSAYSWRGACLCPAAMTLKIEIASDGETATFRLCGRIEEDHLVELQAEVQRYRLPGSARQRGSVRASWPSSSTLRRRPYRLPCLFGSPLFD